MFNIHLAKEKLILIENLFIHFHQTFGDYDEVPTIENENNCSETAPPLPPPRITSISHSQSQQVMINLNHFTFGYF